MKTWKDTHNKGSSYEIHRYYEKKYFQKKSDTLLKYNIFLANSQKLSID